MLFTTFTVVVELLVATAFEGELFTKLTEVDATLLFVLVGLLVILFVLVLETLVLAFALPPVALPPVAVELEVALLGPVVFVLVLVFGFVLVLVLVGLEVECEEADEGE